MTLLASFFHLSFKNMYTVVHVLHEAAHFSLGKVTALGACAVLLCLVVCLTLLASIFLPSTSLINMHTKTVKSVLCTCTCIHPCTQFIIDIESVYFVSGAPGDHL